MTELTEDKVLSAVQEVVSDHLGKPVVAVGAILMASFIDEDGNRRNANITAGLNLAEQMGLAELLSHDIRLEYTEGKESND